MKWPDAIVFLSSVLVVDDWNIVGKLKIMHTHRFVFEDCVQWSI